MRKTKIIRGIIPPPVTAFDSNGEINGTKTKIFIQYLIDGGVSGVVVAASTGEATLMSMHQRKEIIDIGVDATKGRVLLFAGTGHNSTRFAVELSKYAEDAGADIAYVFLPHYPRPTQEGLYQHYKAIAEAVSIPVFAYSWPGQFGIDMELETVIRLVDDGYIQGLVYTSTNLDSLIKILRSTKGKIAVLPGVDTQILPALCFGTGASMSFIANLMPAEVVKIYDLFMEKRIEEATKQQLSIFELYSLLTNIGTLDIPLLKEGIKMLGYDVGDALMPATKVSHDVRERLRNELRKLGKLE